MTEGQRSGPPWPAEAAEPVAIIGIGCRFPGDAGSPEEFWELLRQGRNTTTEVPADRWDWYRDLGPDYVAALRRAITYGSFLSGIEDFDAEFFGVTPREAELMDPMQRILLEVAWEALEHAGLPPHDLAASDAGVFVGVCTDDYARRQLENLPDIEAWTGIGAATCAVANRISYALDLRGPSFAVDTACSASLVAIHLACQSLRDGESPLALVGGINLVVSPGETLSLGEAGALAPDGRSKSFDASADGYGRGEGCGVLVLKRLPDAERDGDRILALIRGSAVNQDGRTNGIMAPCGKAQAHVMERACRNGAVDPGTVSYIEAHGTGTRLGDPLEVSALSEVYGRDRAPGGECVIGSVKSNIGHLEGAAGVAGMIKAVLALYHAQIPANPLVTVLNPDIPWAGSGLRVATEPQPWRTAGQPRRAGVSGFGYGGTIAHVVLEQAPAAAEQPRPVPVSKHGQPRLFPVSAGSADALARQAGRVAGWLSGPGAGETLHSAGHTLALRRSHLDCRAAVVAASRDELCQRLGALAAGEAAEYVVTGSPLPDQGSGLVWVFSGHGSQWAGMGQDLLASSPEFAAVIDELEPVFAEEIGFSPRQALQDGDFPGVDRIQTLIFAMQVGLAAVWRASGVEPAAVIGHSVGEIAAAVTCGALSLQDGARLICRRSKLLRRVAGKGAMAMVSLPFPDVEARLASRPGLSAAIWASPVSTVVAGDPAAVEELITSWQAEGIVIRRVASDVAFHSPHMDPLLDELAEAAASLDYRPPRVPMYSTALADPRDKPAAAGRYWAANLRNPVRLAAAVVAAVQDGYRAFLEVSPHPVVAHSVNETLAEENIEDVFVGSTLRRDRPELAAVLESAGDLHCHGFLASWDRLQPAGELVSVPTTAWQHRRHWRDRATAPAAGQQHDPGSYALLGGPVTVAGSGIRLWHTSLDDSNRPYPGSHALNGVEIVPAAVLVNSFYLAVAGDGPPPVLTDLSMLQPLMTAERRQVQVVTADATARLASRDDGQDAAAPWLTHATAGIATAAAPLPASLPAEDDRLRRAEPGLVHQRLAQVGVPETGFTWTVEELMRADGLIRGTVWIEGEPDSWAPLLDAVMSLAPAAYPGEPVLRMVVHAEEIVVSARPPELAVIDIVLREDRDDTVDVLVADADGQVVARVTGLRYAVIGQQAADTDPRRLAHELAWRPLELTAAGPQPGELVLIGAGADLDRLRDQLQDRGLACRIAAGLPEAGELGGVSDIAVMAAGRESGEPLWQAAARAAATLADTARELGGAAGPRLWCLTTGVRDGTDELSLVQAPLWALGRVLGREHGSRWGGVIDLDPRYPAGQADALRALLRAAPAEDIVSVRDTETFGARLVRAGGQPRQPLPGCRGDGTYLVTGGLSGTGMAAAAWLADRGAKRIVLSVRQPLPPRRQWDQAADETTAQRIEAIRGLEARGVTVRVLPADLASGRDAVLADLEALDLPPVAGVVHAAGRGGGQDHGELAGVIREQAGRAEAVHELFPPGSVDFMVLLSCCGYLEAGPGQAAAAAFLDALAAARGAASPGHTMSISWDPALRLPDMTPAWEFAARLGAPGLAVLRPDPQDQSALLREAVEEITAADEDADTGAAPSLTELAPAELRDYLVTEVRGQVAAEMKLAVADLNPRRSLAEQGLDSVMTLKVRRRLEKRFGQSLPTTLLWQKPTVAGIAEHLAEALGAAGGAADPGQDAAAAPDSVPVVVG
ncbi:MAG TPA: acyltransferase domain-containing protein [Streptosporangiaceae bacterium]|jgi:6-methylsalicylic acid synthase